MKKWVTGFFLFVSVFVLTQWNTVGTVSAGELSNIREEQEEKEELLDSLDKEVHQTLEQMSEVTDVLSQLELEIENKEEEIEEAEKDIEVQNELVLERMEQARTRLRSLQTNEVNQNALLIILNSESFSDFLNKAFAVIRLTDAGNQQIEAAQEEQELLEAMQSELISSRIELQNNTEQANLKRDELEGQVAELRDLIDANEAKLAELQDKEEAELARIEEERLAEERRQAELAAERAQEEERRQAELAEERAQEEERRQAELAEERAREAAAASEAAEATTTSSTESTQSANDNNSGSSEQSPEPEPEPEPESNTGAWMTMNSTGYSRAQPVLSNFTRTGIDLRQNPRVIAVDPSVIPLNSIVEVEGMGTYIAGDTGGAINGNIIDIHFPTVEQALSWGRRNVRVRIIN